MNNIPELALSIRQPWAWACGDGCKPIENRSKYAINLGKMKPGRIAIHASKGMTRDEYESAFSFMASQGVDCPRPDELVRGAIIGEVTVVDVVNEFDSPWFFGPWGLVLADAVLYEQPKPASGQLGYFKLALGGEIEQPKPWMLSWPEPPARRKPAPRALEYGQRSILYPDFRVNEVTE